GAIVPTPQSASPAPAPFTAGWQNGFALQTTNGDYRLQVGLLAQTDGRFSIDDAKPITNTFSIRKARVILVGRIAKYFDYRIMPDFGNGATTLFDAYLDLRFSTKFRLRTGKDKTPFGYELLIGDGSLLFPERSLTSSLVPNRDIGVQAQGDLAGGKFSYSGGVFNGIPDGANSTTEVDTNNSKDVAGRVVVYPFRKTITPATPAGALSGLGFHLGGAIGSAAGALPSFRTSIGQTYFAYTGANASGDRSRVSPAVFYYYKSFGAFGEYVRSTQNITKGAVSRDITNQAFDVSGTWVLTGEAASGGNVTPKNAFDPPTAKWGAIQLVARYAQLRVDDTAFDEGFATAGSSRRAQAFTVGANWWPVTYVKYYATYERTVFDEDPHGARPAEDAILFRVQFAF
ncbi:MAG: porin, partial [Acidobacteriota bacterium]